MQIVDLNAYDKQAIEQTARLLVAGFGVAWPDYELALEEVEKSFGEDRISRVACDEDGRLLGWIGGISSYGGNVWELLVVVVDVRHQRQHIGSALVRDFEERVKVRGGVTIMLGTDDEEDKTTLAGINLYPNVWEHIACIKNLNHHPYEFYQKQGYVIVGVVPDANGPGKPDILMAKSLISKVHHNVSSG